MKKDENTEAGQPFQEKSAGGSFKNEAPISTDNMKKGLQKILSRIKEEGDNALFAYTEEFDHAKIDKNNIRVTEEEIREAMNK